MFMLHNFTFFERNRNIKQLKIVLIIGEIFPIKGLQPFCVGYDLAEFC